MTNKKLYLIGDPVDHSLSPLLHGAMIAQTGVHYTYEVRRVQTRDLADFVAEAKAGGCAGFNVTMPHKEAILPLLDELSPAAAACGAVNTVCIKNGRAIGYNTDGPGFVDSLRARGLEPEGKTVLLLGTGGAGDAICDALVGAGVKKIFVTNRSVYPAQDLAARYPDKAQFIYFGIFPVRHAMAESDLFINATSLGMAGMKEFSDLGFLRDAPAGVTVYDLVYNPRQTMLLREAEKRGLDPEEFASAAITAHRVRHRPAALPGGPCLQDVHRQGRGYARPVLGAGGQAGLRLTPVPRGYIIPEGFSPFL